MVDILTAVLTDGLPAVEAACAEVIAQGVHSADVVLNILSRQRAGRDRQFGHVATAPIFRNCQRRRSDNRHTARPGPWDTLRRAASLRRPSFGTQKIPTCGISRRADSFMLHRAFCAGALCRLFVRRQRLFELLLEAEGIGRGACPEFPQGMAIALAPECNGLRVTRRSRLPAAGLVEALRSVG